MPNHEVSLAQLAMANYDRLVKLTAKRMRLEERGRIGSREWKRVWDLIDHCILVDRNYRIAIALQSPGGEAIIERWKQEYEAFMAAPTARAG